MSKRAIPTLLSPRLVKAIAHPTRLHVLMALENRVASPSELAKELGETTRHVAYHVKKLLDLGCVELVSIEPAGNGRVVKHNYTSTQRPYFEQDDWEQLSDKQKHGMVMTFMSKISQDVSLAMAGGTFNDPDDNHISRTPMTVDDEGWQEVTALLDGTAAKLQAIQEKVILRTQDPKVKIMRVKVAMIQFRSPSDKD